MAFEKLDKYAGEMEKQVKRVGESAKEAWTGEKPTEQRMKEEPGPTLGLPAMAGLMAGAGAAVVFSTYHDSLCKAAPEAAVLGSIIATGTAASLIASAAAAKEVAPHMAFFGVTAGLGGVYFAINRFLESKRRVEPGVPDRLPTQALAATAVAVSALAVATSYWAPQSL